MNITLTKQIFYTLDIGKFIFEISLLDDITFSSNQYALI